MSLFFFFNPKIPTTGGGASDWIDPRLIALWERERDAYKPELIKSRLKELNSSLLKIREEQRQERIKLLKEEWQGKIDAQLLIKNWQKEASKTRVLTKKLIESILPETIKTTTSIKKTWESKEYKLHKQRLQGKKTRFVINGDIYGRQRQDLIPVPPPETVPPLVMPANPESPFQIKREMLQPVNLRQMFYPPIKEKPLELEDEILIAIAENEIKKPKVVVKKQLKQKKKEVQALTEDELTALSLVLSV